VATVEAVLLTDQIPFQQHQSTEGFIKYIIYSD